MSYRDMSIVFMLCAKMILKDYCPPDTNNYLCMEQEDDSGIDCELCWSNFLDGLERGRIAPCVVSSVLEKGGI